MGKPDKADKERDYVKRDLEEPVDKLVDQKLNDPAIATKKGYAFVDLESEEALQKLMTLNAETPIMVEGRALISCQVSEK